MKINWGSAVVLAFIAFISFILFFVIQMSMDSAKHDLVTEDYYKAELGYQNEIDAENNAKKNALQLTIKQTEKGFLIDFPSNFDYQKIKGEVSLYRPSDKNLDFKITLKLSNTQLLIPYKKLTKGRWNIKVFWHYNGEAYLHKEQITY